MNPCLERNPKVRKKENITICTAKMTLDASKACESTYWLVQEGAWVIQSDSACGRSNCDFTLWTPLMPRSEHFRLEAFSVYWYAIQVGYIMRPRFKNLLKMSARKSAREVINLVKQGENEKLQYKSNAELLGVSSEPWWSKGFGHSIVHIKFVMSAVSNQH